MDEARALQRAADLAAALDREIAAAGEQNERLRRLDAAGVLAGVQARHEFLARVAALQAELGAELERLATPSGARSPPLDEALAGVRRRAAQLARLDAQNLQLARHALAIVRGWLDALRPGAAGYDRAGRRAAAGRG